MPDDLVDQVVRDELHRALGRGPTPTPDWDDLEARLPAARTRRRRRRGAVAVAMAVLAVAAVAVVGTRGEDHRVHTVPVAPAPAPTTTAAGPIIVQPTVPSLDHLPALSVRTVGQATVPGAGLLVAGTDGGAWVAVVAQGQVVHLDPTGRVMARVALPPTPGSAGSGLQADTPVDYPIWLAAGEGSIWALSFGSGALYRIDPATNRVTGTVDIAARVDAGQAVARAEVERVAAGLGHVWVTVCCDGDAPNQRLVRIDPTTLALDPTTVALPGDGESETPTVGTGSVLVVGEGFETVAQVDPVAMSVTRQIAVPGGAGPVASADQVWGLAGWSTGYSTGTGLVTLDPTRGTSTLALSWPTPVQELAAQGDVVWARGPTGPIMQLAHDRVRAVPGSTGLGLAPTPDGGLWYVQGSAVIHLVPTS